VTFNFKKEDNRLLVLLLITDLVFMIVHFIYRIDAVYSMDIISNNPLFSIEKDWGYSEIFQYIKEYWVIILLVILSIKNKHIIYFSWTLLFIYLLLDDSLQIHENFGSYLVTYFDIQPMFDLRAQDLGELLVTAFSASFLFSFIAISTFFSSNKERILSLHIFILVFLLAFFGVIVDMLHEAVPCCTSMWALMEDGGEMIIMSFILWYIFGFKVNNDIDINLLTYMKKRFSE